MPRPSLSLAVVGADYPNKRGPGRRFELNICRPGERVHLVPEPKNPADSRAVAVYSSRDVQIGYLTAERAPWIGSMLGGGREISAIFQKQTRSGAWVRVAFDGEEPVLLPDRGEDQAGERDEEQAQDFWPDPDWPD